ncbi:anhydro-N-acetylmuramic acid kinase [Pseudemcibacter aquimaris]|uniref:anhydro-N-acetylmuramic acid kinase n=1 Tax=Pseudemcibacter aquimaris TaxID=2857064 RepID=UPI0020123AB2|nr:anhydro-N-acetylmuramic acid kinase [Pseudemcibacter aquimaris]MCC3860916.1 anhydro-N-acetylmuramic acid kinase [Pseudemcibacter aquimaris]WDU59735.1 anhydro-N-acetylmuramic acid kinase [Pseudemcibacter aquimaris]
MGKNKEYLAIGLMSGTSVDGVDAAIIKTDGYSVKRYGKCHHLAYSKEQQKIILEAIDQARDAGNPDIRSNSISMAEGFINEIHTKAVQEIIKINDLNRDDIDVVGFHGQTLLHNPDKGWSWQIGDGREIASELGITVINDFRRDDVENGGQGAPLVPIFHRALLPEKNDYPIALLNIGGVANITWIGGDDPSDMLGFDTGPGNALLDDWVREHSDLPYDKDGELSASGSVQEIFVNDLMNHEYFTEKPPKSLDRNEFGIGQVSMLSPADGAATLIAFTVAAVKMAEVMCPDYVKKWYVCGGGAHNPTMMKMLSDTLYGDVEDISALGFDGDYVEAEAFAYFAVRKLLNLPITFPGTTGVSEPSTGGKINKP